MKRVIQVYKPADAWTHPTPPGIGDFLRGLVHLHEAGKRHGFEVLADVSATEFVHLTDQTSPIFWQGETTHIRASREYHSGDNGNLVLDLWDFVEGEREVLYVSTNLGDWRRSTLPIETAEFARQFYAFNDLVTTRSDLGLREKEYSVLSIRCGDRFFGSNRTLPRRHERLVREKLEREVLPYAARPLVVMSDSSALKHELAARYDLLATPSTPYHASRGGALSVCNDLDVLSHSSANYHINASAEWWSGFSHYTSLIWAIPSINFAPVMPVPRFPTLRRFVGSLL